MKIYNKLVRDKIVEIIQAKGQEALFHTANDTEYEEKLLEKLAEEVAEFSQDKNPEEMADIFEVITALFAHYDWKLEDIIEVQKKKRQERGGFEKKIILEQS